MDSRLDLIAPEIATVLHGADGPRLRRIAAVACSLAIATAKLEETAADAAYIRLRAGVTGESPERAAVWELAQRLDQAQRSQGRNLPPPGMSDADHLWMQARAADALWCAMAANPLAAALECVYEAHHAGVDMDTLRSVVATA